MKIDYTKNISFENYNSLREAVGWKLISRRQYNIGIRGSQYIKILETDGKAIGLIRAIGDGGYYLVLVDVIIHPDYQGNGLGRLLLEDFMKYADSITEDSERLHISLIAAKGKEAFYEKFGFTARPTEDLGAGMSNYYTKETAVI